MLPYVIGSAVKESPREKVDKDAFTGAIPFLPALLFHGCRETLFDALIIGQ
jgi:hypothetical protein